MRLKMKLRMKNRSHRYDINSSRPRYGDESITYRKYLCLTMLTCIKRHLSNI